MKKWKNFTATQLEEIGELFRYGRPAASEVCPACRSETLHWYSYCNPQRSSSMITYIWCGSCKSYHGETTAIDRWELFDPLEDLGVDDRVAMEADLEKFFSKLDAFWLSGQLPQTRPPDRRRLRSV